MLISATSHNAAPDAANAAAPTPSAAAAAPPVRQATAPAPAQTGDASVRVVSTLEIKAAVAALNKKMEPLATSVRFALDDSTGKTVITMLDTADNSVLRQFPSNETLSMIRALDQHSGLLVNTKS